METIQDRYDRVLEQIYLSAQSVGRKPESIRLVVVTKRQPVDVAEEVIAAGARFLGENYADEAIIKKQAIEDRYRLYPQVDNDILRRQLLPAPFCGVQWHIIGHVQSRKARIVAQEFDYLHSLDSLKLAQRLEDECIEKQRILPVLLEVNVSGEETKSGWQAWDERQWGELILLIEPIKKFTHLRLNGLMTMPPFYDNPEMSRPYFKKLRNLQEYLHKYVPDVAWSELSMGMSGDFNVAVQEGATWVRVGQAILGPRST